MTRKEGTKKNNQEIREKISDAYEEYGQLHADDCIAMSENRFFGDECSCAVREMVKDVLTIAVDFISHDMKCDNEEQRKAVVKAYIEDYFGLSSHAS